MSATAGKEVAKGKEYASVPVAAYESEVVLEKLEEKPQAASLSELYQTATSWDHLLMLIGTIASVLVGGAQPLYAWIFGQALDGLNGGSLTDTITTLSVYMVYIGIGIMVMSTVQCSCWSTTGNRQGQKLREMYVMAMLSQEIGWFDKIGGTQLATKLADLTGTMRDGMTLKTADMIQYFGQIICSVIVGFALDPYIGLIMVGCTPLIGGSAALWIETLKNANQGSSAQYANAGGLATESLTYIRTVSALNAHPDVITKYRKYLIEAMNIGILKGLRVGLATGGLWFVVLCTYAVAMWFGSKQISDTMRYNLVGWPDAQSGGKVYGAFFALLLGSFSIGQMSPSVTAFVSARVAVGEMLATIRRKPLIDGLSNDGEKPTQRPRGLVELKNIVFSYPSRPNIQVCKGYNLTIPAGQSCALVGASGSGKSTVISLLLRFYDPEGGSINLDGVDIKSLNTRWLRAQIGYVGQEPVLFSGTIADNIAYGLDVTFAPELANMESGTEAERKAAKETLRNRVIEAAKLANAHDFVSHLPQGYDTDVGSGGSSISGGQKQRLAIARALIKKPAVLLLDEATSALDATSEKLVQESIDSLQQSKAQTTIIVAHRLSTIRTADKIAVVSKGLIAEEGTHNELVERNGLYADLIRLQMEGQEDAQDADPEAESQAEAAFETVELSKDKPEAEVAKKLAVQEEQVEEKAKVEISKEESKMLKAKIWDMILQYPIWFLIACIGSSMVGAMFPIWGVLLAKSMGIFFLKHDPDSIIDNAVTQVGYYVALAADAGIGAVLQQWGVGKISERIVMKLRSDQFESTLRREIGFFDLKENAVGDITTRLSDDARTVAKATGQSAAQQIQAVACLAIGLALGFWGCWKVALVVLATIVPMVIAGAIKMAAYAGQLRIGQAVDDANLEDSLMSNAFTQMRTVTAFSVQFKIADQYIGITRAKVKIYINEAWIQGIAKGLADAVQMFTFALLFWYASDVLNGSDFTFENVMTAIFALMFSSFGLGSALNDLGDVKEGLQAARRIFKSIDEAKNCPIDGLSNAGTIPTTRSQGRIELKNVNFCYPTRPNSKVCKDYNLVIEPGEMVALVGPSGSGKSTIMNLLLRFYDPLSGQVLLDGVDVKTLNIRWLRSQIGYVGQEPVLFKGSIASNVAKGRPNFGDTVLLSLDEVIGTSEDKLDCCSIIPGAAPAKDKDVEAASGPVDEDIIQACRDSNAHDFIMGFSKGYDTDVGESSMMVSGGQKQRIAIARALIKKPAVLLLDEATSALDAGSEKLVQESIDALQQSKMQTTIVIAHRLTTIKNADKIAVIEHGRVVEVGKHDELLAMDGLYAELWNKQRGLIRSSSSMRSLKST